MSIQDIKAAVASIEDDNERFKRFMQLARSDGSLTNAERQWVAAADRFLQALAAEVTRNEVDAVNSERAAASQGLNGYDRALAVIEDHHRRSIAAAEADHRAAKQRYAKALKQTEALQERIATIDAERVEAERDLERAAGLLAKDKGE